jgi:hypothetical protein
MAAGRKTGGRKAGVRNKKIQSVLDEAEASGEMPAPYMLRVMRDKKAKQDRRDDMAKAAAPYYHPRLTSVEHGGKDGGPIEGKITIEFVQPPKRRGK